MSDDKDLEQRLAGELERAPPIELHLHAVPMLQLVGLAQLALRHPELMGTHRTLAERIVSAAALHFRGFPAVLEVIERGNDRAFDEPASEVKRWT